MFTHQNSGMARGTINIGNGKHSICYSLLDKGPFPDKFTESNLTSRLKGIVKLDKFKPTLPTLNAKIPLFLPPKI